jgi:hypothetical protein
MTRRQPGSGVASGFRVALAIVVLGAAAIWVAVAASNDRDQASSPATSSTTTEPERDRSVIDGGGLSPLQEAVAACDVAGVEDELEKGGRQFEGGRFVLFGDGEPSLDSALACGAEMATLLATYVVENEGGDPVLQAAVRTRDPAIVTAVLDAGADVDAIDDAGDTALLQAASVGDEAIVRLLLQAGADPDIAADSGHTPLFRAVAADAGGIVEALLGAGADPGAQVDVSSLDILAIAVQQATQEVAEGDGAVEWPIDEVLAVLGPELGLPPGTTASDSPGIINVSTLYLAVALSGDEVVLALLDAGADPTAVSGPGPYHHLPAEAADALGRTELAERIRAAGG